MSDLTGRTVLLTGASGGIGAPTARALLDAGAQLVAHYAGNPDDARAACADFPPDRFTLVQTDLSRRGAARCLWRNALAWRGAVDAVVVNAATNLDTPLDGSDETWDEGWETTLRVNVIEPASLMREAVNHWLTTGGGCLVTISSWAAQRGSAIPQSGAYASSKAAIHSFAQTIARNHAGDRILSYIIAPGIVHTPMSEVAAVHRGGIDKLNAMLPMGAMVEPEEVGRLITWLAAGGAPNLTGATLDLNGSSNIR
jgi:NAD(P)-dependent dehydrogenase (short-subunit alcohol dehydrogenase family)